MATNREVFEFVCEGCNETIRQVNTVQKCVICGTVNDVSAWRHPFVIEPEKMAAA